MQNLNYNKPIKYDDYKISSLKLKLLRNINATLSYVLSVCCIIAGLQLVKFILYLYVYYH